MQEKKEASYKSKRKQVNKHTNNLYSAALYNVSMAHKASVPAWDQKEV